MTSTDFKSPLRKLVAFFQQSRDHWRQRAKDYHGEIRALEIRVRDLAASRDHWRHRYFAVRPDPALARTRRNPPAPSLPPSACRSLTRPTPATTTPNLT